MLLVHVPTLLAWLAAVSLLPVYLNELGVHSRQDLGFWLGLVGFAGGLGSTLGSFLWAMISRRLGTLRTWSICLAIEGVLIASLGQLTTPWQVVLNRFGIGLASATIMLSVIFITTRAPDRLAAHGVAAISAEVYAATALAPLAGAFAAQGLGTGGVFISSGLLFLVPIAMLRAAAAREPTRAEPGDHPRRERSAGPSPAPHTRGRRPTLVLHLFVSSMVAMLAQHLLSVYAVIKFPDHVYLVNGLVQAALMAGLAAGAAISVPLARSAVTPAGIATWLASGLGICFLCIAVNDALPWTISLSFVAGIQLGALSCLCVTGLATLTPVGPTHPVGLAFLAQASGGAVGPVIGAGALAFWRLDQAFFVVGAAALLPTALSRILPHLRPGNGALERSTAGRASRRNNP